MAKTKRVADALLSGVKTPAQMKAEMAVDRARGVMPKAERDANRAKFLEQSADPRRFYHGTKNPDITEFMTRKDLTDESMMTGHYADERDAVFLSPEPDFTSSFSVLGYTDEGQAPTTYPVYAQIKNPFDFDNPEHLQRVKDTYKDMYHNPESELYDPYLQSSERSIDLLKFNKAVDNLQGDPNNWGRIENQKFQDVLKDIGYDSFYTRERGTKNLGVYDPNKIKSAIGNQGTYDTSDSDITKARGGIIKMGKGGVGRKVGNLLPKAERDANLGKMLDESAIKDRLYHGTTSDITKFDPDKARSKTGNINALLGTFMSDNPAEASRFASEWGTTGGNVMPVYASLKNPYNASYKEMDDLAMGVYRRMMQDPSYDPNRSYRGFDKEGQKRTFEMLEKHEPQAIQDAIDFKNKLIEAGHDGIIWNLNGNKEVIAFEPTQIKSAIGNQGTYDTTNPDITKAKGGAVHMAGGGAGRKLANKMLPKVEAPSIMTRSDISELADYIKNREGGYGLRRVERAADEIPRLGEMYTQDALRSAFSGDNARALMTMKPADFEKFATPLDPYFLTSKAYRSSDDSKMGHEDYIKHLEGIQARGGFKDVPFFEINKEEQGLPLLPFISGHEGRHRSRAMTAAGENAGLVQLLPRSELREPFPRRSQEDYIEALKREMAITGNKILPQTYTGTNPKSFDDTVIRRPAIDLPDFYANGGAVKMSEGGEPDQAEIDRMRLEMSNSPVIQATPQTPIQRAIGTLGGYMDRAGQFVSESIEPLAEKHPIKHFLGELLLADSLKSAGTAMQDYTKTSRDITEDQPYVRAPLTGSGQTLKLDPRMLDVMGIAQPVASATTRLVGAGAKKAAPFAKDVAEMASELYMKGEIPGMIPPNMYAVSPEVKPSKVLAPANEMGFYSATEAAALNLPRKSGSGQAFLNDLLKQENVRPDEINAMGLDTFLKGKKDVTAAEVQDYIANNKIQLGEKTYKSETLKWDTDEDNNLVTENLKDPFKIITEYGKTYVTDGYGNFFGWGERFPNRQAAQQFVENLVRDEQLLTNSTKYGKYTLPGGENYREIVLTLPEQPVMKFEDALKLWKKDARAGKRGIYTESEINAMQPDDLVDILREEYIIPSMKKSYKSSHWDEPNALAHLRMSDRVTDGKKTLLVDEVQSDWHQEGREKGYKGGDVELAKGYKWDQSAQSTLGIAENDPAWIATDRNGNLLGHYTSENAAKAALSERTGGVPDAPFKDDWYQLALKRAVKEAIDGGYDRVALPTGARVAERFDLSKQIDRIDYNKNDDGTYSMSAIKDGREVFAKEGLDEKELSGIVGKDVAKKIVGDEGSSAPKADRWEAEDGDVPEFKSLSGLDLQVGGEGMRKYYDEIYPGYLKKFGKKYGANVGMTQLQTEPFTDRIFKDVGKYYAYTGQGRDTKEFNTYAEALKFLGIGAEPLHYMEITPAMREAFKTGIHMKRGGKVQFANNIDAMRLALSKG